MPLAGLLSALPRAGLSAVAPAADLSSVFRIFTGAAAELFENLSQVAWLPFSGALLLLLLMQLARARAWHNVLRTAYPQTEIAYRPIAGAFLVGVGVNAVLPARAGDAAKIVLARQQIPGSTYPAVTSSFAVQTVFDTAAGLLVLAYALSQGLLPTPPQMPQIPALDYTFWTTNYDFLILVTSTVAGLGVAAVLYAAHHVRSFWQRVRQGAVVLATPGRYLRRVASWQGAGWLLRFGAYWLFLEAFGIGGSFGAVMLVMSVQAVSNLVPLTPGGAGAQQALLVATLEGPSRIAVLSFSVGTQIAMSAWGALVGLVVLILAFGTSDWRGLVRTGREQQRRHEQGSRRDQDREQEGRHEQSGHQAPSG